MKTTLPLTPLIAIALAATLTGCATNGDVENIQAQIDGVKTQVAMLNSDIGNAHVTSMQALQAAKTAENNNRIVNQKLDAMLNNQEWIHKITETSHSVAESTTSDNLEQISEKFDALINDLTYYKFIGFGD